MAALDVAQFLWNKFLDSLQEAEAEAELSAFSLTLIYRFRHIKEYVNERTLERILSTNAPESILDSLYDLNELLAECRIFANRLKQQDQSLSRLISLEKFLFKRKVKRPLLDIMVSFDALADVHLCLIRGYSEVDVSKIIEFDAHAEKIESLLLGNKSDRSDDDVGFAAIGIVGLPGVGKTTLVQKIFNSPTVRKHFSKKVWICLNDLQKEKEVVMRVKIVKRILDELGLGHATDNIIELLEELKSFLSNGNGRYLIVLDDVCHTYEFFNFNFNLGERKEECLNLWNWLRNCNGAVIVTSRKKEVAEFMVGDNNFLLHLHPSLSKESCWKIFQNTIRNNRKRIKEELKDEIMEQCHGLPLAAKDLAGIIAYKIRYFGQSISTLRSSIRTLAAKYNEKLQASYVNLENIQLKLCLLFLSIFPKKSVIKKRPLIYWWIGEGLIKAEGAKTAEEVGEEIFVKLIAESMIIAKFDNKWNWSPVVNRCRVHPGIRYMLIALANEAQLFVFDSTKTPLFPREGSRRRACLDGKSYLKSDQEAAKLLTIFNVDEGYPSFSDADWLKKLKNVVALQLGRWQDSVTHHIEMEDNILKDLGAQKHLKYLSLRGISRITELPNSIVNLISLEILDLRACHNLERLPDKIESLRKLTHLDVSECYLLESMPKGLEKLPAFQVLKGFVVGDPNETSCRIGNLGKLKKLRKLSIHIGKMAVIRNEEFEELKEIESLCCLTISWGKGPKDEFPSLSFPFDLEKLDLRAIPLEKATEWLQPSKLTKLKKLCIRGGKLNSLDSHENGETSGWKVEILYLKYLTNLNITFSELQDKFPHLRYLEKVGCHANDKDIVWDKSKGQLWPKEKKSKGMLLQKVKLRVQSLDRVKNLFFFF